MPHIRQYEAHDHDSLYEVCLRTGADGDDATGLYQIPTILGEVYVGPYLEFHPDLSWVIDNDGTASGYVLGAPDTKDFESRCENEWWPQLRERYPLGSFAPDSLDEEVVGHIHLPPRANQRVAAAYPAHLHIDLAPEVQGLRLGGALISVLLDTLTARGVAGVHLGVGTKNARAMGFYQHLGFTVLSHGESETTMGKLLSPT
ncbi:MAG: GNAT family N-acetyltransferase [Rhodoglobus sp.]